MIHKWERTEPIRLYLYTVTGLFLSILAVMGVITDMQLSSWILIVGMACGVVSGTEFARAGVDSPATVKHKFDALPEEVRKALEK